MALFYKSNQNSPFIGSHHTKGNSPSRRMGYCPLRGNPDQGDQPGTIGDPLAEHAVVILQQGMY